jgi:nitrite reductase/ring-hydroxylating ferredoxin subunit
VTVGGRRVRAGRVEALAPERPAGVDLEGTPVFVVRVGDAVYACGGICAHKGGPLVDGKVSGVRVACPWHGWMYDVRTGACVFPGRGARVPTYTAHIDAGEVWIELPGASSAC